jgi:hypothetical protein
MLPIASTENNEVEKDEALVRFYCRHLVSLSGLYYGLDSKKRRIGTRSIL